MYISEAHAKDEWPVGDPIKINQPKVLSERLTVANEFRDFFGFPEDFNIVVDNPDSNQFDNLYSCWPTRFYGVNDNNIIGYKAEPDNTHQYDIEEVKDFLETVVGDEYA